MVPEELLGRFFSLLRIVSLAAGVIFNYWLLDKVAMHGAVIFLGLSLLYGIGLTLLCCKVKEGKYPPPPPEPPELQDCSTCVRVLHGVSTYFRQSFSMSYYRWFMAAVAMSASLAFGPVNFFAIQYTQSISCSMKAYGICLVISLTASLCLSYPLGWIADRFHPLRTGMYSLVLYLILMIVSYPLMSNPKLFGLLFTLHCLISGIYTTLTASLMPRLLPRSLFAQFSSAGAIVGAGFNMIATPLFGWLIDAFDGGYRILFILGGLGTLATLAAFLPVCRGFRQYGGYSAYHAPEPE